MKTKIFRIGKKSLSVIIVLMMIVSTMLVGTVTTNAASAESDSVGASTNDWYIHYKAGSDDLGSFAHTKLDSSYQFTYTHTNNGWFYFNINQDDSSARVNTWSSKETVASSLTIDNSVKTYNPAYESKENNGIFFIGINLPNNPQQDITITFDPVGKKVTVSKAGSTPIETTTQPTTTTPVSTNSWVLCGQNFGNWTPDNGTALSLVSGKTNLYSVSVSSLSNYFGFYQKSGETYTQYGPSKNGDPLPRSSANAVTISSGTTNAFNIASSVSNVTVYLDDSNSSSIKVWYESATEPTTTEPVETTVPPTTTPVTTSGDFKIVDKTAANGKLTFSAPNKAAGTASADDEVTVTATPDKYFECTAISVSYKDNNKVAYDIIANKTADNTFKFTVPSTLNKTDVKDQEITVKGTFTLTSSGKLNYVKDQGDGLWIDVAPDQNDSTSTLIKWNNYYGKDHNKTTNPYTFYVPKNVDLENAKVYNGFDREVKLNGVSIPANNYNTDTTLSLTAGTTYNSGNDNTYTVKVMQGSTNAMFLTTSNDLPTQTDGTLTSKDKVEYLGGSCKTMTDTTDTAKQFSAAMALDSVKGRGNSSWEASYKLFGKYAFNMKLASKTNLFGMDSAKSWCLLANNADESMMRNALTYQLAKEIGIQDSPEFSFVDIYDNGEYLGAYLITEKVDVGSSKLVKGESFEDLNEKGAEADGATEVKEDTFKSTYSYGGTNYSMQYAKVSPSGVTSDSAKYPYETKGKYLLEFELKNRLFPPNGYESNTAAEASWFRSPRGQYVVVKSPEFATKEQVEFIAKKFAEMEAKVFTANASKSDLSTVMDVESFAKMYLIQEFSSNLDSAATSYYMTFDCAQSDPVFVANPVWDYDWAYGQYEKQVKEDVNGTLLNSADPKAWFAKAKQIGDNEADGNNKYSIQSQLASNSDSFKSVVRKVWEQENGFYDNIKKYYGDNSQIDTWYNQIKDSVDMNETRWGFIASDPLINFDQGSWGSKNTGANHAEAVYYLENTWTKVRAEEFLNTESGLLNSEYAPYTPAKPAISAYNADLSATITSPINAGSDFVIKVTSEIESGVKYRLYEGFSSAYLYENKDGVFSLKATGAGPKTYTVKAVFGANESSASDSVEVTVVALDITDVTIESSKSTVKPEDTFTLTATAVPSDLSDVTYKFYQSSDSTVSIETDTLLTSSGNTATVTAGTTPGNYYYYVVAKDANNVEKTSSIVTVKVTNEGEVLENVKIRFKGTTLSSLIPYMSVDGETASVMTRSTANPIGTHLSGAYRFVWFEATIDTVTVGQSKTLTFTTEKSKESTMNASITLDFTTLDDNVIYLAVDNLMSGTTAVDITDNETAKNSFGSAMNMIKQSSAVDPVATTLLSTMLKITSASGKVTTKRYYLGDLDSDNTIGIKDATEIQKSIAGTSELDAEYQSLGDFNADGVVDIKDATAIQKYIAGI